MRVGILGGGQLGMMLAEAVAKLGGRPRVMDPEPHAPARARGVPSTVAGFDDADALRGFVEGCDVVTYEREDLPLPVLRAAGEGVRFVPSLDVLAIAQDRVLEKSFFRDRGLPTTRWQAVGPGASLEDAALAFGLPAIAKTTRGGYDGRGQYFLNTAEEARAAQAALPGAAWILEEPVAIVTEASCLVARSPGEERVFPVLENLHRAHILDRSVTPPRLGDDLVSRIRAHALAAARGLDLEGVLAVEVFVTRADDGERVLLNELAPRPHNSGHLLSRACRFGQFDALARILVGAPVGDPAQAPGSFCMGNLLGDVWASQQREHALDLSAWVRFPEVAEVHLYGKQGVDPRRKMGHFVVEAATSDAALQTAGAFRQALMLPRAERDAQR